MNINFTDPILFICIGILLIGFVFIVWAVGKLRQKQGDDRPDSVSLEDDSPLTDADLGLDPLVEPEALRGAPKPEPAPPFKIDFKEPRTPPPSPSPTPAASKEVTERLEAMTQRLSEMQALLNKQNAAAVASAANAPIGQGFSSETIDKLLKIIGNVIQQVDTLQKAMNMTKEPALQAPVPGAAIPAAPVSLPKPPMSPIQPLTAAPGPVVPKPGPAFPPAGMPPKP